jgi:CheY-specific phosphatase CheX
MSDAAIGELLAASAQEVLETMFFAAAEAVGEPPPIDGIAAGLEFHGEPGGSFRVGLTRPAARSLAAAFLGQEENEISEGEVGEVVCELANMICGSVLSRLEARTTFEILHPELLDPAAFAAGEVRTLRLENGALAVTLALDRPA